MRYENSYLNTDLNKYETQTPQDQAVRIVRTIGQAFDVGHPPDLPAPAPAQTTAAPAVAAPSQDMPAAAAAPPQPATAPPPAPSLLTPHTPSASASASASFPTSGIGNSSSSAATASAAAVGPAAALHIMDLLAPLAPPPSASASAAMLAPGSPPVLTLQTPLALSGPPAPTGDVRSRDSLVTLMDITPGTSYNKCSYERLSSRIENLLQSGSLRSDRDARAEGALSDSTSKTDSRNSALLNDLNLSSPSAAQLLLQHTHLARIRSDAAAAMEMSATGSGTSGFGSASSGSQPSELLLASSSSFSTGPAAPPAAGPLMAPATPAAWQSFSPMRTSRTAIGISTAGCGGGAGGSAGSSSKRSANGMGALDEASCMSPSMSVPRSLTRAQAELEAAFGGLSRQCCLTDSASASASASTCATTTNPFLDNDSLLQSQALSVGASLPAGSGASASASAGASAGALGLPTFEATFESMLEVRAHSSSAHKRANALVAAAPPDGLTGGGDKQPDERERETDPTHMRLRVAALEERVREQTEEMRALSASVHCLCELLQKQELCGAQEKVLHSTLLAAAFPLPICFFLLHSTAGRDSICNGFIARGFQFRCTVQ